MYAYIHTYIQTDRHTHTHTHTHTHVQIQQSIARGRGGAVVAAAVDHPLGDGNRAAAPDRAMLGGVA